MFSLTDNCLAIIPPLCYHKTEGGACARTNIHFNKIILDKSQLTYLDALTKDNVIVKNERHLSTIRLLLSEACEVKNSNISVEVKNKRLSIKNVLEVEKITVFIYLAKKQRHGIKIQ